MSNYSLSDAAIRDLDEICEYIARSNPRAASKLFDDIRSQCKLVASFPNMGKSYGRLVPNLRVRHHFQGFGALDSSHNAPYKYF